MKVFLVSLLTLTLLFFPSACGQRPSESPEFCFESHKDEFVELKDLALAQEGLFNIRKTKDGAMVESREIDETNPASERIGELMEEIGLDMVYVRPEEDYFGFQEGVEFQTDLPHASALLCYCSTGEPEYSWSTAESWISLGDGWYYWYIEQV